MHPMCVASYHLLKWFFCKERSTEHSRREKLVYPCAIAIVNIAVEQGGSRLRLGKRPNYLRLTRCN